MVQWPFVTCRIHFTKGLPCFCHPSVGNVDVSPHIAAYSLYCFISFSLPYISLQNYFQQFALHALYIQFHQINRLAPKETTKSDGSHGLAGPHISHAAITILASFFFDSSFLNAHTVGFHAKDYSKIIHVPI